jgi:hypothetical protein
LTSLGLLDQSAVPAEEQLVGDNERTGFAHVPVVVR